MKKILLLFFSSVVVITTVISFVVYFHRQSSSPENNQNNYQKKNHSEDDRPENNYPESTKEDVQKESRQNEKVKDSKAIQDSIKKNDHQEKIKENVKREVQENEEIKELTTIVNQDNNIKSKDAEWIELCDYHDKFTAPEIICSVISFLISHVAMTFLIMIYDYNLKNTFQVAAQKQVTKFNHDKREIVYSLQSTVLFSIILWFFLEVIFYFFIYLICFFKKIIDPVDYIFKHRPLFYLFKKSSLFLRMIICFATTFLSTTFVAVLTVLLLRPFAKTEDEFEILNNLDNNLILY